MTVRTTAASAPTERSRRASATRSRPPSGLDDRVGRVGGDRGARVGRQRPRRGRPHQQRDPVERGAGRAVEREAHEDARVLDGLGSPSATSASDSAVPQRGQYGRDLVGLDQEARARAAASATTRPTRCTRCSSSSTRRRGRSSSRSARSAAPVVHVARDRTRGSGALNSATPNASMSRACRCRADLLLHLELDRQAVAVPAALPRHVVARSSS